MPTDVQVNPDKTRSRGRTVPRIPAAEIQILIAIVVLAAGFSLAFPDAFASSRTLTNMTRVAGILAVVSIGQTCALVVGGFDLSVGAVMGLSSVVGALMMKAGIPVPVAILGAVATGAVAGLINGIGIAVLRVTPFVMTLGMLTAAGGFANQIANGGTMTGLPRSLSLFGRSDWLGLPSAAVIAAILIVVMWALLNLTRIGLYIFSIGGSPLTAQTAGINVPLYQTVAYVLCSACAGMAGDDADRAGGRGSGQSGDRL